MLLKPRPHDVLREEERIVLGVDEFGYKVAVGVAEIVAGVDVDGVVFCGGGVVDYEERRSEATMS